METLARSSILIAATLYAGMASGAPRLTFERIIRPAQSLGTASDIAIIDAIGENDKIDKFLDSFLEQTNRSGTLRVLDATSAGKIFSGGRVDRAAAQRLRRTYPVEVYGRITSFTCGATERSGEGGAYDEDGRRIRRNYVWVDAVCQAGLEFLDAETFARIASFRVSGEGTSPRQTSIAPDDLVTATRQAARYTGVAAAEQITPRRIRETIVLIEDGPRFAEAMSMIDVSRLDDARRIWESVAANQPQSAALRFDLGAVSEASGDVQAAARYYEDASRLAPDDRRFREELEAFRRRNGIK